MGTPSSTGLDPEQVQIGTANGPGIYIAPAGTPGPPDHLAPWEPPWRSLGYLSDDGPTIGMDTDTETITPWQSVVPIRTIVTSREVTLGFTMWQLNQMTLALYFDTDPVENGAGSFAMDVRTDSPQHIYAVGIDAADVDRVLRVTFGRASLSDAGDMQIERGAAIPLEVTMSALEDQGRLAHIILGIGANGNGEGFSGAQHLDMQRNGNGGVEVVPASAAEQRRVEGQQQRQQRQQGRQQ